MDLPKSRWLSILSQLSLLSEEYILGEEMPSSCQSPWEICGPSYEFTVSHCFKHTKVWRNGTIGFHRTALSFKECCPYCLGFCCCLEGSVFAGFIFLQFSWGWPEGQEAHLQLFDFGGCSLFVISRGKFFYQSASWCLSMTHLPRVLTGMLEKK